MAASLRPPFGLDVLEAFRRFGHVPVMAGGAADAAPADGGTETSDDGGGNGLYDQFMSETPDDLKPYVTDAFKKWDSQVTPKLQEAAQIRDRFGPLSEIEGLSDVPAEELSELLEFRSILSDPEQLKEWIGQVSNVLGMEGQGELSEEDWLALGEQNGWFEGSEPQESSPEDIARQVIEMLQPQLEPMQKALGAQEQERTTAATVSQFQERLGTLLADLDDDQRQEATDVITDLAWRYLDDDDPIGKAFERYQQIRGSAQGSLVDRKLDQPEGSLNGGRPSTSPPALSWNGNGNDPKTAALARFKQG